MIHNTLAELQEINIKLILNISANSSAVSYPDKLENKTSSIWDLDDYTIWNVFNLLTISARHVG